MEILSISKHIAKKEHKCNFCHGIIKIGEKYGYQALKDGGIFYTWKSHLKCDAIASELNMYDSCDDGLTDGDFCEYINEEFYKLQGEDNLKKDKFSERLEFVCNYHLK